MASDLLPRLPAVLRELHGGEESRAVTAMPAHTELA